MNKFVGISLVLFLLSLTLVTGCDTKGKKGSPSASGSPAAEDETSASDTKVTTPPVTPKGTDSGSPVKPKPPEKPMSLKLEKLNDATVKQGATAKVNVKVTRENVKGEVALKVEGLDKEKFKVKAPKIEEDEDTGTIEITVADDAKVEAATVTVTAEAAGKKDSATMKLTVEKK